MHLQKLLQPWAFGYSIANDRSAGYERQKPTASLKDGTATPRGFPEQPRSPSILCISNSLYSIVDSYREYRTSAANVMLMPTQRQLYPHSL